MLDGRTPSQLAAHYREFIAGCDTRGPDKALIRFRRVLPNPRERLNFPILPASEFNSTAISPDLQFSARPIGTGPFNGKRGLRMVTFDAFANTHHQPNVVQLQLQEGGDPLVQSKTLVNNNVQGIIVVPPGQRPNLSASDDVTLKSYDLRSWWYIAVNPRHPALAKKEVRQALNMVLDRNELRQYAIGVKPGERTSPYYNQTVPVVDRANLSKAQTMFTAAGLERLGGRWHINGEPITLRIGMLSTLDYEATDLLDQIGNQLGAAGFDRQTDKVGLDEWNRSVRSGQSDYDMVIGKWSFGLVEQINDLFHTKGRKNIFNFSNETVDSYLDEYDRAVTDTEQRDAYHKVHKLLAEELPYLFLWKLDTKSAWRTEVRGNIIAPYYYFTEIDSWKVEG
jgi:peptide/nickel transport system substrate-binding protein